MDRRTGIGVRPDNSKVTGCGRAGGDGTPDRLSTCRICPRSDGLFEFYFEQSSSLVARPISRVKRYTVEVDTLQAGDWCSGQNRSARGRLLWLIIMFIPQRLVRLDKRLELFSVCSASLCSDFDM